MPSSTSVHNPRIELVPYDCGLEVPVHAFDYELNGDAKSPFRFSSSYLLYMSA